MSTAHRIAWLLERLLKLLRRKDFLISTEAVFLSNVFQPMDNTKARTKLHWRPRPVAETIKDAVEWYAQRESAQAEAARVRF